MAALKVYTQIPLIGREKFLLGGLLLKVEYQ